MHQPGNQVDMRALVIEGYAEQLAGLPQSRLANLLSVLQEGLNDIPKGLHVANPAYQELVDRRDGARLALGSFKERMAAEALADANAAANTGPKKPGDLPPPPAFAIRIDGGIDVIDAAGQAAIASNQPVGPEHIITSYGVVESNNDTARPAPFASRLGGTALEQPRRRVDPLY